MAKSSSPPKFSSNKLLSESGGVYSFTCFDSRVQASFSSRRYSESSIAEFVSAAGIKPNQISRIHQVHGSHVQIADGQNTPTSPSESDAILTQQTGNALLILTADCLPLFLYDPEAVVIGLIHAGWRGLKEEVISSTIDCMIQHHRSDPKNIQVAVGPAIEGDCYEVGSEFEAHFPEFYQSSGGPKGHLNLRRVAWEQLIRKGVREEAIFDPEICTKCQSEVFYSARGGSANQRILSIIALNN